MKRCPTCQKTFDDAMRFCQTDGTPLIEDAAPADPYKTMVASKEDIAAALRSTPPTEPKPEPPAPEPAKRDDEPLQIPSKPLAQSTPASEIKTRIAGGRDDTPVIDLPPLAESTAPDASGSEDATMISPSFPESTPPPSPFAAAETPAPGGPGDFPTTPPIPSPFGKMDKQPSFQSKPAAPEFNEPEPPAPAILESEAESASLPKFAEPESPASPSPAFDPFQPQAAAPEETAMSQSEWTPPTPASSFQDQPGGTNMSSMPPAAGQNKTLAIISLVCGILGLTVCCGSFIVSIVALVLGFMARGKANQLPAQYGGAGLAMGGIITGALGLLGSLIAVVAWFIWGAAILATAGR